MRILLPFPHKLLWPNGRTRTPRAKYGQQASHKAWAWAATKEVAPQCFQHNGEQIPIKLIVYPKRFGPTPDEDNCVAAAKYYLDGIAMALGVNDRVFRAPTVEFGPREGRFVIQLGDN